MSGKAAFAPTKRLISAQVAAILNKDAKAPAVGIRAEAPSDLGETLRVGEQELPVACCESVLEVRERLAGWDASNGPLIIVANLEDRELGYDVLARLAKRRFYSINPWQLVKEKFHVQDIDPRITEPHPWVAQAVLDAPPSAEVAPASSGFLDAETLWKFLFGHLLGFPGGRRDAESILEWSLSDDGIQRLIHLPEEQRQGFLSALEGDPLAAAIFGALVHKDDVGVVAVGLVARIVFDDAADQVAAAACAARLEPLLTGPLSRDVALDWAEAAEGVLARKLAGGVEAVRPLLEAADALVERIGAGELVEASRFLRSSWEGRWIAFAHAIEGDVATASSTAERIFDHALAEYSETRVERARMALRLRRWLETKEAEFSSFADAASSYREEGGHVDWAIAKVWEGDSEPQVARAYESLLANVVFRRERENQRFGELLSEWSRTGVPGDGVLPVEDVLEQIVSGVARAMPVLVVVIDGMSVPVFRELFDDVVERGFTERAPEARPKRRPVISVFPSVTELSRTSLLCGKLVSGNQATEKEGFGSHAGLRKVSKPGKTPVLFHRGDLREGGSGKLAERVRSAVFDPEQAVVGVVINAIDDHLAKGDQVRVSWNCHTIRPLEELVDAARDAGRAMVFVSDHGHIAERDLEYRPVAGDRERWREASGEPGSGEILLEGPRVLVGSEARIIAPWSEKLRYATKKNGYHGGASPQEVVIPLAVVAPASIPDVENWVEVPGEIPSWWSDEAGITKLPPKPPPRKARPADKRQIELFAGEATWVDRLFSSETFQHQRELHKRVKLEDQRIRDILLALDERGKLTSMALAQRLGVPSVRLPGILASLRRLINVDGYEVIAVNEVSDTVSLDRTLLFRQFELEET